MSALRPESMPVLAPGHRLQWEPVQHAHVLLFPEGMVILNDSAREILNRCDGRHSLRELIAELEQAFDARGLEPDVLEFLQTAIAEGWVREH